MFLGEAIERGFDFAVTRLFAFPDPLSLPTLVSCLLCVTIAALAAHSLRVRGVTALVRLLLPRRVFAHRSSLLDYKLVFVNSFIFAAFLGPFVIGSEYWKTWTIDLLAHGFGPAAPGGEPSLMILVATTALQLLALDFGYWIAHLAFHKVEFLWEFHKVHHSAEVMTPATEWRQHPVELFVFPIVYGLTSGVVYGAVTYVCGPESQSLGLLGQNVILLAHLMTIHHIRHSHIWMPMTGLWGRVIHSPGHHHIHHSDNPIHFDKNLGYLLSVWDWMFGTLHVPRSRERISFGIGPEGKAHSSVWRVMSLPVLAGVRRIAAALRRTD